MNSVSNGVIKVILFAGIIFCIFYYVGYRNWLEEEIPDVDYSQYIEDSPEEEKEPIENSQDYNFDQAKAKLLYEKVNYKMVQENFGSEFVNLYYEMDANTFSDEFIIYLGIINLYKNDFINNCYETLEISKYEVQNKIKEIFGDIDFSFVSFESRDKLFSFIYDNEKEMYIVNNKKCSGIEFGIPHVETDFIKGVLKDDYLEIYEYVYYVEYIEKDNGALIPNFYSSLNNNGTLVSSEFLDDDDKEKMPIYKIVFSLENGEYVLKGIKRG